MTGSLARPIELGCRRPSLWVRALRVLATGILGGLVATGLGLAVHEVATGEAFRVARVRFEGERHASVAELRHLSDIRTGQHLFTLDLERAVRGVERHPWVKRASARRSFPSTVTIRVAEYEPVAVLALEQLWYVDAGGTPFARARGAGLDLPVITGLDPKLAKARPDLGRRIIRASLDLLTTCARHPVVAPDKLSEIHFDPNSGFELVLRSGTRLELGVVDPTQALSRLDRMVAVGFDPSRPSHVDLVSRRVAIVTPLAAGT